MPHIGLSLFAVALTLLSSTTQDTERAFLLNSPRLLHDQLSAQTHLNISLPEPILFSDQVSHEQAFFLFQNIFARFATFEFYPEPWFHQTQEPGLAIFKARWSFRDKASNDQHVFQVFFLLKLETPSPEGTPVRARRPRAGPVRAWKIAEIKAEKL